MKLSDYLAAEKLSHAEFGKRVGVSQVSIHRYSKGLRLPRPEIVARIAKETRGKVTIEDHYQAHVDARSPEKRAA